jgi:catechol 2,3-dioxygenase-like lactoylglutathione lyase family enzyme
MDLPEAPVPKERFFVTHFITVENQARSREFYAGILGGKVINPESPCIIRLENSWIILNDGGGPTPDKPEITLEPLKDPNRINSFLNLRVADIDSCYRDWKAKGAHFITEPLDNHGWETRCYMRDPDGYIIEVGQATQKMIDLFESLAK